MVWNIFVDNNTQDHDTEEKDGATTKSTRHGILSSELFRIISCRWWTLQLATCLPFKEIILGYKIVCNKFLLVTV